MIKSTNRINGFEQIKAFYSWVFGNNEKNIRSHHISLYMFLLNQNNRNNWVEWFKCPFDLAMTGAGIGSKKTYYDTLDDLQKWNLVKYEKGVNNWKAPLISLLVLNDTSTVPQCEPQVIPQVELLPIPLPIPQVVSNINLKPITYNIYKNIETFLDFRNSEYEKIDNDVKIKLSQFGINKPQIRNTNNSNRQYIDVVEVLMATIKDSDWRNTICINQKITEYQFSEFIKEFIGTYVSDQSLNYDESKFKGHFTNWLKRKLKP